MTEEKPPRARGELLQWGVSIDTDGKAINVTMAGGRKPDIVFETLEAFVEWFEEEWEGLQIARLGKKVMVPVPDGVINRFSDLINNVCNCGEGDVCSVCGEMSLDGLTFKKKDNPHA